MSPTNVQGATIPASAIHAAVLLLLTLVPWYGTGTRSQLDSTGLSINFLPLLKTIAILVRKCLPLSSLVLNLSKRHNLKFVKLEFARILG